MKQRLAPTNRYIRLWRSRGFVVILLVVVVFLSVSVAQETVRRLQTKYEIEKLEADVARLEKRNTEIKDVIALLSTSTSQEKEARVKLGKQAPGEQVVIIPGTSEKKDIILPDSDIIEYIPTNTYESNPTKWKRYFIDSFTTL